MPSPPKIPKSPSPAETAAAQIGVNREAAKDFATLTNISQNTPFGSLNQEIIGYDANGLPIRRVNTQLSAAQQALLNALQGTQGTLGNQAGSLFNAANYGELPDLSGNAGSIVQENLRHFVDYWQPFHRQQTEQLDNQLRNQGLTPGTEAYDRAMRSLQANQGQQISGFISSAQPIAFNQALETYKTPLNVGQALLNLSRPASLTESLVKPPENQQFQPPNMNNIQATTNQANQFAAQMAMQQQSALLSGIAGIGSALLPFMFMPSDEEIKKDIERIGRTDDKQNIYRFKYKDDPIGRTHIGLMAQEVEKRNPSAVHEIDGVKYVDYAEATSNSNRRRPKPHLLSFMD